MRLGGHFRLARLFGINIDVGISWFFVLFLYIFVFTPYFHDVLGGSSTKAYVVTVLSVLSFFASLVLHELGHALVARRNKLQVVGIELWALGGITRTAGVVQGAGPEFRVAAAGPLVTLAVALVSIAAGGLVAHDHDFFQVAVGTADVRATPAVVWLSWLATLNVLVLLLNLVPAYPLDGGQIAHALIWWRTGDRNRATAVTGRLGQGFALLAAVGGAVLLVQGNTTGIWILFVAWFVYQGATAAVNQGAVGQRVADIRVADIMDPDPVTVSPEMALLDVREQYFLRYRWPWFAVVDEARRFLGVVTQKRVDEEIAAGRPALTVGDVLQRELEMRIAPDQSLEAVLMSDGLRRLGAVVAVDGDGVLRGVITTAQVRRALAPAAR